MGLSLKTDQVAFRCNLVSVENNVMIDYAGGSPSSDSAAVVINQLNKELGNEEISFHSGVSFRHSVVAPSDWAEVSCTPPHDLTGDSLVLPSGPSSESLIKIMEASKSVLADSDLRATQIWLWGQGFMPQMPSFSETYSKSAGLVTAVDLLRGIATLTGIEVCDIPGATGQCDTDYEGKRDIALQRLQEGMDLFIIHVEATDEAGHAGDIEAKVQALENWDQRILKDLIPSLDDLGPWRMLMLPDHATPLTTRTHTSDPVPYLIVDSQNDGPGGVFTENGVSESPLVKAHQLLPELLRL